VVCPSTWGSGVAAKQFDPGATLLVGGRTVGRSDGRTVSMKGGSRTAGLE
jgi:hypothetical protein